MLPDIVSSNLHEHNFTRLFLCTDGASVKQQIEDAKLKKIILQRKTFAGRPYLDVFFL